MRNSRLLAVAAILGLVATLPVAASGSGLGGAENMAAAKAKAAKDGQPVLLKFSTEW
jgi:hypothetical protein